MGYRRNVFFESKVWGKGQKLFFWISAKGSVHDGGLPYDEVQISRDKL